MNIYLDTSHIQKWSQGTLSSAEISILNRLKDSGTNSFALSLAHICDIIDRDDREKAIQIAAFLDQLPIRWVRNAFDLKREELKNALDSFKHDKTSGINPFVTDYVDTLEPEPSTALIIPLMRRGSSVETIITDLTNNPSQERQGSISQEHIRRWARSNVALIDNMPLQKRDREMQKNLKRVLHDDITNFKLSDEVIRVVVTKRNELTDPIPEFISWLIKNPQLIPSIWCPYYTQHYMHRDKNLKWKKSHFEDLQHLTVLPYVDYLTVDRQIHSFAMQALRFAKRHIPSDWGRKLIISIDQIN